MPVNPALRKCMLVLSFVPAIGIALYTWKQCNESGTANRLAEKSFTSAYDEIKDSMFEESVQELLKVPCMHVSGPEWPKNLGDLWKQQRPGPQMPNPAPDPANELGGDRQEMIVNVQIDLSRPVYWKKWSMPPSHDRWIAVGFASFGGGPSQDCPGVVAKKKSWR